jgi:hypothetical protein
LRGLWLLLLLLGGERAHLLLRGVVLLEWVSLQGHLLEGLELLRLGLERILGLRLVRKLRVRVWGGGEEGGGGLGELLLELRRLLLRQQLGLGGRQLLRQQRQLVQLQGLLQLHLRELECLQLLLELGLQLGLGRQLGVLSRQLGLGLRRWLGLGQGLLGLGLCWLRLRLCLGLRLWLGGGLWLGWGLLRWLLWLCWSL